jgi:hypothetical protein
MEQALISSAETNVENTNVSNNTTEKPVVEENTSNEVNNKAEDKSKSEENSKNYQLRKQQEAENYKRQLAEKERLLQEKELRLQELTRQQVKAGEVYDPVLDRVIPENLSAIEYRELMAVKYKQDTENKIANKVKNEVEVINSEKGDAFQVMQQAVHSGVLNENMVLAAVNKKEGMRFLYNLIKENPEELKKLSSISNPYEQAAEFGELFAKYKNKPSARSSNSDVAPNILGENRGITPTDAKISSRFREGIKKY